MKRFFYWTFTLLICSLVFTSCQLSTIQTQPPSTPVPSESATATESSTQPTLTPTTEITVPTPTEAPQNLFLFPPFGMNGTLAWKIADGQPVALTLPDFAVNAYDRSALTGRILHPSAFPDHGAGPANLSVGDLYIYDIQTGSDQPIFTDQTIVEAVWAPNGEDFVYLLATDTTYELHFRTMQGEDFFLAKDVAPVFNISPDGNQVVFTRESGYRLGEPGVYIVPIRGGQEGKISEVDRAGMGSVSDIPLWSSDSRYILLSVAQMYNPLRWFLIATDGSLSRQLSFTEDIPERYRQQEFNAAMWMPDSTGFIGVQWQGMMDPPYAQEVLIANLDLDNGQITDLVPIDWGGRNPIAWAIPGSRLWEMTEDGRLVLLDLDNPSPFPSNCKQAGLYTFANPFKGYCFAYPQDVILQAYEYERPLFLGPALDDSLEPLRANLWVETKPVVGATLLSAVDEFIASQPQGQPAIKRSPIKLGGESVELIENVPGRLLSKVVIAVKGDLVYFLWFNPADPSVPEVAGDINRLFEAVVGSWSWLEIR